MDIQKGDRVSVNVAPFIGSVMPCDESIPCEVLEVEGIQVHVRALPPYRAAALWVLSSWIDAPRRKEQYLAASLGLGD